MKQQREQSKDNFTLTHDLEKLAEQVEEHESTLAGIVKHLEEAVKRAPDDFGRQPSELILCLNGLAASSRSHDQQKHGKGPSYHKYD
jgi:hypothetical protein